MDFKVFTILLNNFIYLIIENRPLLLYYIEL